MARQLKDVLQALDRKDRKFYDRLSDQEKKELNMFTLPRYMSSVDGISDLQEWYILATNEYVNKDYWATTKHPKLQWLLLTTISPGMGNHFHPWIAAPKRKTANNKKAKLIEELFPELGDEEMKTMEHIYSEKELKLMKQDRGD